MSQLIERATKLLLDRSTEYEVLQGLIDEFIEQVEYKEAIIIGLEQQLAQARRDATEEVAKAHRRGWEQAKAEAIKVIDKVDNLSRMGCFVTADMLKNNVAAMEYKEDV